MSEYVRYGDEWKKQMMKMSKSDLVDFLAKNLERATNLEEAVRQYLDSASQSSRDEVVRRLAR